MTTEQWNQVRAVFDAVLERPASKQTAFLDAETDDPEVRAKVEELLHIDPVTTNLFGGDIRKSALDIEEVPNAELEGKQIGPYRILEPLGRGGMGSVYLAEREDVQKQVALKFVGVSLSAATSAHRFFLIEQRVLARLEHPNIARFLDAGITEEGVPFFVMEYVEGEPITEYCNNSALSEKDRLRLFADVCEAVGYAHRSLIVHRDLKPSNIFVTKEGTVKLLDFGIAKLLEEEEGDGLVPGESRRLMTPAYAAPEQLADEAPTTATDVYQLGVVLRELLTGDRSADNVAELDTELASIIAKATQDEPDNRYASAENLLEDLLRFQHRQPVSAHPDTVSYLARKFIQRNRWSFVAGAIVMMSLLGGLGAALWQARVAGLERDQAQLESQKSEEVTNFLMGLFEASDPSVAQGDTIMARELLARGVERIDALEIESEVRAMLLAATGKIYYRLGDLRQAETLYLRSLETWNNLGPDWQQTEDYSRTLLGTALTIAEQDRHGEAEQLIRRVITLRTPEGPQDAILQNALFDLYVVLHGKGRAEAANEVFRSWERASMLPISNFDAETADRMQEIAITLILRGQIRGELETLQRGRILIRRALTILENARGPKHPSVALALKELALALLEESRQVSRQSVNAPAVADLLASADSASLKALELHREIYSEPNILTWGSLFTRAEILRELERYDEAEALAHEALSVAEIVKGRSTSWTQSLSALGKIALDRGEYNKAEKFIRQARDWWSANYGAEYLFTLTEDFPLSEALTRMGQFEAAEARLTTTYEILEARRGPTDNFTRVALGRLVELYEAWNKPEEAARYRALLEAAETRDD